MSCIAPVAISDESVLITYPVDSEERMTDAILNAFAAGNVDTNRQRKTLHDQIDPDAIDEFDWDTKQPLLLAITLWGHHTVLTPEAVWIYKN